MRIRTQLHKVADGTHNNEADTDSLADLGKLLCVRYKIC